jgi:hypothetical protein
VAQPEYVPAAPKDRHRVSERLPTPASWHATRPGEVVQLGGQPTGPRFGVAGPDQGYALKLARLWEDKLVLAPGEHLGDAKAGCVAVALKRAGTLGRAPVTFDLELAFAVYGFLEGAPADLVAFRQPLFRSCAHDYNQVRDLVDRVPEQTLRLTPAEVRRRLANGGWRVLLGLDPNRVDPVAAA